MTPQYVTRQELDNELRAMFERILKAPPPPVEPPQPAPAPGLREKWLAVIKMWSGNPYAAVLPAQIAKVMLEMLDDFCPADGPPFGIKPACAWILLRETPPLYECESCHRKIDADDQRPACNLYHWPVPDGGKP